MNARERIIDHAKDELVSRLKAEIAQQKKSISHLTAALDRSRGVTLPPRIVTGKKRQRAASDRIRYIFGDMHGIMADRKVVSSVLSDIEQLEPDEIVLLGDMVNCGGFLAQHHTLGYVSEIEEADYEHDIAEMNRVLDELQRIAPQAKIHYLEGNHEDRVERWCITQTLAHRKNAEFLRQHFSPEYLLKLKERGIPYYRRSQHYHGLPVMGVIKLDKCFFTHSNTCARHAASVMVSQLGGCVVFGNTHRIQADTIALASTGQITAWSVGCSCKLAQYWHHGSPKNHAHGAGVQVVTKGGRFMHINYPFLNGESLLPSLFGK